MPPPWRTHDGDAAALCTERPTGRLSITAIRPAARTPTSRVRGSSQERARAASAAAAREAVDQRTGHARCGGQHDHRRHASSRAASAQRTTRRWTPSTRSKSDVIDPSEAQSATAVLDKISGAVLLETRQKQARLQYLTSIVEQLVIDNKRARDTEAAVLNMQLRRAAWRRLGRAGRSACSPAPATTCARGVSRKRDCMEPQPRLAIVASIQQAITHLLTTYEPEFLRFGYSLFVSFATILIVWHGIKMMLTHDSLGDHMFEFAKLLLFISFGYALIAFYESPIPGIGVSFSNLITDQAHVFANILDARSLELVFDHLDTLWGQFVQPDAWSILANLLYWLLLIVVTDREGRCTGDRRVWTDRAARSVRCSGRSSFRSSSFRSWIGCSGPGSSRSFSTHSSRWSRSHS